MVPRLRWYVGSQIWQSDLLHQALRMTVQIAQKSLDRLVSDNSMVAQTLLFGRLNQFLWKLANKWQPVPKGMLQSNPGTLSSQAWGQSSRNPAKTNQRNWSETFLFLRRILFMKEIRFLFLNRQKWLVNKLESNWDARRRFSFDKGVQKKEGSH